MSRHSFLGIEIKLLIAVGAMLLSFIAPPVSAQSSPATPPSTMPSVGNPPAASRDAVADAVITSTLNNAFESDPDLSPLKLNVDTSNGNVSLHGIVPSGELRDRAVALAGNVRGVKTIESDLVIQP